MGIYVLITKKCNLRCKHCYVADYQGDMPDAVLKAISEKYPDSHIIFHGGEPTLAGIPRLESAIEILGNRGYVMQSNLMEIPQGLPDLLFKHFSGEIGTSFDEFRLEYFHQWLENVESMARAGITIYVVMTVSDGLGPDDYLKYIDSFANSGAAGFALQPMSPVHGKGVTPSHYKSILKALWNHKLNRTSQRLSSADPCTTSGINGGNCARLGVRTVSPDGTVYVCPDFAGQGLFPMGNILDSGYDDSIDNPGVAPFYHRELAMVETCDENCWLICRGGCTAYNHFTGNSIQAPDPLCAVYKEVIDNVEI